MLSCEDGTRKFTLAREIGSGVEVGWCTSHKGPTSTSFLFGQFWQPSTNPPSLLPWSKQATEALYLQCSLFQHQRMHRTKQQQSNLSPTRSWQSFWLRLILLLTYTFISFVLSDVVKECSWEEVAGLSEQSCLHCTSTLPPRYKHRQTTRSTEPIVLPPHRSSSLFFTRYSQQTECVYPDTRDGIIENTHRNLRMRTRMLTT